MDGDRGNERSRLGGHKRASISIAVQGSRPSSGAVATRRSLALDRQRVPAVSPPMSSRDTIVR